MSALPFLFAAQAAFVLTLGWRTSRRAVLSGTAVVLVLSIWGAASTRMAWSGVYDEPVFLATLPGLWLPGVPFAVVALLCLHPAVRTGLSDISAQTSAKWLVAIQALRITALGTLLHTAQGTFPLHVELAIGLTDLAFGLSALWVFLLLRDRGLHPDALAVWHLTGMAIILVPGMISLQLGLAGPLRGRSRLIGGDARLADGARADARRALLPPSQPSRRGRCVAPPRRAR